MIPTSINGRWTLSLPDHRAARPEWQTGWEVERIASMHANLKPGMHLIDCGTEEGDMSGLFASWGCDVTLIEPNPRVWPNVKAIWEANNLPSPRACVVGFVADSDHGEWDASSSWPACANGPLIGDHGFRQVNEWPDQLRIRIDTLSQRLGKVDAITMDIEGAEVLAMRGAKRVLCEDRPLVWMSVHPPFMSDIYRHRVADLWAVLRECGYTWTLLDYDHELHVFARPADGPEPML